MKPSLSAVTLAALAIARFEASVETLRLKIAARDALVARRAVAS